MKNRKFSDVLKSRVEHFFSRNRLSEKGNSTLWIKTAFWLSLWFVTYISLMTSSGVPGWTILAILCPLLGIASAGIGFNIMHDASHKAYSQKKELNTLFALTLELVGPSSFLWFTKHVRTHHTYVNTDHDDDIDTGGLLRMSPNQPHKWFHRYQHMYAWLLYGLLAFQWIYFVDYKKLFSGKIHRTKVPVMETKDIVIFWTAKAFNLILFIILPVILYGPIALLGWGIYLFVVGLIISIVFQLAHIHEHAQFQETTDKGKLVKNFYEHQVYETLDFAVKNKTLTWLLGGLNFQVVHHLFPYVSHVHYPAIQPIIKKTCQDFTLPYVEVSGWRALVLHYFQLKKLGRE